MTNATAILSTLATLPAGSEVILKGYATKDGRIGDYTLELCDYDELLADSLRLANSLNGNTVAATYGVSAELARAALRTFRASLQGKRDRRAAMVRRTGRVEGGMVYGKVIARSTPSRRRGRVVTSPAARVVAALELASGLSSYRGFYVSQATEVVVDGVSLDVSDTPTESAMPAFDPYAYGFAKVSAEEGEGSW